MQFPRVLSVGLGFTLLMASMLSGAAGAQRERDDEDDGGTGMPIKHIVVIFQENVSFDHYFATYPVAANRSGEPRFVPADDTPTVNGLDQTLLTANPNAANPKRLARSQALTCDMDHGDTDEQKAFNHGLMDKFVEFASGGHISNPAGGTRKPNPYNGGHRFRELA